MNLFHQSIAANAATYPTKAALVIDGITTSYQALQRQIEEISKLLIALGVSTGDRISLHSSISAELIAAFLGTLQAGAITAAIHPTMSRVKLIQLLNQSDSRILITDNSNDLEELIDETQLEIILLTTSATQSSNQALRLSDAIAAFQRKEQAPTTQRIYDAEMPTSIFYTSGSTFNPKGVLVNHRIMVSASKQVCAYLQNTPDDRVLSYSTLASDYGVYNVMMPLYIGATSVVESQHALSAKDILEVIKREAITAVHAFPPVFFLLADTCPQWQAKIPSLRYISSSGQPLRPHHIRRIRNALPKVQIFSNYGLTECKRVSYLAPSEIDDRPSSVGKPLPGVDLYLVDNHDRLIEQPDQIGELLVTSDFLMLGYWKMPEANDKAFVYEKFGHSRLYRTGDLFKRDSQGYLYYVARKDDVFTRSMWNVNPREIELCLAAHPAVAEVAVVAVPNESTGHEPKAFIVLESSHAETAISTLDDYCKTYLDWHMVPAHYEFVQDLPKADSGKLTTKGLV